MNANLGSVDRSIRIALGLGLIAATVQGEIGAWGWIGVVPMATGFLSFCPVYRLFGWNTK